MIEAKVPSGLCGSCVNAQTVASSKGSAFLLCRLSFSDPRFRKYPPLPVVRCSGHAPLTPAHQELRHDGDPMTDSVPVEYLWFLDTLVRVRVSHRESPDRISVLEHTARRGDSPPLHVHVNEDEVFHILEGEFRFRVGSEERRGGAGDTVLARKGVPHTYLVDSARARWLTVTTGQQFEDFVRAMAKNADAEDLPPSIGPPTPQAIEALTVIAKQFGIDIVGPPLH